MSTLSAILGVALVLIVLGDAFETIVLPRRVTRQLRLARLFFRYTWRPWSALVGSMSSGKRQETYLSFYGPLSLLLLLMVWAAGLIVGFAFLYWANGSAIHTAGGIPGFSMDLYLSATTFFTLGLGDVIPQTPLSRALVAVEAGIGFGFLALVIGYLPALNQSFSRREVNISLLDARAGSPPTAAEMLRRHSHDHGLERCSSFSAIGKAGRRSYSRAIYLTRCSPTFVRNTITSPGWGPLQRFWIPAPSSWQG